MSPFKERAFRKRYSLVDTAVAFVVLVMCLLLVMSTLWNTAVNRINNRYFSQHSLGDPELAAYAERAYEEILARRDVEIPAEDQKRLARLYHNLDIWQNMWWLGVRIQKNPCDLWMMQQIIVETRPDYIIEAGTFRGGSALYFASVLNGLGLRDSKVITIDIKYLCEEATKLPLWEQHVEFIHGSSTDRDVVAQIRDTVRGKKVLVVLDSNHSRDHVIEELRNYGPIVSPGSYMIVEDTLDGLALQEGERRVLGPMAAVQEFLDSPDGAAFSPDISREALILTWNSGGWLKKRAASE